MSRNWRNAQGVFMVEILTLDYGKLGSAALDEDQELIRNLSAAVGTGRALWTVSDETSTIERLIWTGSGYGEAESFRLDDYFPLPKGKHEVDVEGLALDGRKLWLIGSHSLTRSDPYKNQDDPEEVRIKDLVKPSPRVRRCLLGYLLLSADGTAIETPSDGRGLCLPFDGDGDLRRELARDKHIAPFLALADKENGLDIEGLSVDGERVMLGLRGPVLRSQVALVVALRIAEDGGALRLKRMTRNGPRHWTHFLPLGGAGIRDIQAMGDDLVLLSGPTMGFLAPFATHVWKGAMTADRASLVDPRDVLNGPVEALGGDGKPEVLSWLTLPDGRAGWLVLHDGPGCSRYTKDGRFFADFHPA